MLSPQKFIDSRLLPSLLLIVLLFGLPVANAQAAPGDTTRISVASDGSQANADSQNGPSISADGRYVAFDSFASNLVSADSNNFSDIFVHDRTTGATTRVSVASDGTQSNNQSYNPSISADGRYVAFFSAASNLVSADSNNFSDIFVHDRTTGATTRVSVASDGTQANEYSYGPSISADGRYVAFFSRASNLVSGDTNNFGDIFVHDRTTGATTCVSVASDGTQANSGSGLSSSISVDGRYVVFESDASNLVSGDTNGQWDIFVHDRTTFTTTRISVASDGTQANGGSGFSSISADGRYVAFSSYASNLVNGDINSPDIFVNDRTTGVTTQVSVASDGTQANGGPPGLHSSISADGHYVAFDSDASNLISGDTNNAHDIFVHELDITGPTVTNTSLTAIYIATGPSNFTVTFSEDVDDPAGNTGTDDVTNPANYLLVNKGANGIADTISCGPVPGVGGVKPDDTQVMVTSVSYNSATFTARVTLASALPAGSYRLFVCGTTSIVDLLGNILAGNGTTSGTDFTFDFTVQSTVAAPVYKNTKPAILPATGFAPGQITRLPAQPGEKDYASTELSLEIPALNLKMPIVGVPQVDQGWDVSWLGNSAGWLEGSAFPTWAGNTILTGHVWNADNTPGIFAGLKMLKYGDQILIHAFGQVYTYEVRESQRVSPTSVQAVMKHENLSWLTLLTCEDYRMLWNSYSGRRVVRAVLISVK